MFDLLLHADLMVPDPDVTMPRLVDAIGFPAPKPHWRHAFPTHSYTSWYARAHPSLAVAPTRLNPQGLVRGVENPVDPCFEPFLESVLDFQGRARPIHTHATVLVTDRFEQVVERLRRRALPFRIAPRDAEMPFDRLWVGVTPEDPTYRPTVDGGLIIEILPLAPLQLPAETFLDPPPVPLAAAPQDMVRITSRGFLVRDLDRTVRLLSTNLDWEPVDPIEDFPVEGFRRARMGFGLAHSAVVDIMQPTHANGEVGRYVATWGPGPYHIRIAVHDLTAKAEDLRDRGTRFEELPADASCGPRIRVAPEDVDGALFEFEEVLP